MTCIPSAKTRDYTPFFKNGCDSHRKPLSMGLLGLDNGLKTKYNLQIVIQYNLPGLSPGGVFYREWLK